jgi:hypothetical protein
MEPFADLNLIKLKRCEQRCNNARKHGSLKAALLSLTAYLTLAHAGEAKEIRSIERTVQADYRLVPAITLYQVIAAQNNIDTTKVEGIVKVKRDAAHYDPAEGITVIIEGTDIGTTTDTEGRFVLWLGGLPKGAATAKLLFSFIGFAREERIVSTNENTTLEVLFDQIDQNLTEFVVVDVRVPWYKKLWPFRKKKNANHISQ